MLRTFSRASVVSTMAMSRMPPTGRLRSFSSSVITSSSMSKCSADDTFGAATACTPGITAASRSGSTSRSGRVHPDDHVAAGLDQAGHGLRERPASRLLLGREDAVLEVELDRVGAHAGCLADEPLDGDRHVQHRTPRLHDTTPSARSRSSCCPPSSGASTSLVCSPSAGPAGGSHPGCPTTAARRSASGSPRWRRAVDHDAALARVAVGEDNRSMSRTGATVTPAASKSARLSARSPAGYVADHPVQLLPVAHPRVVGGEPRIALEFGPPDRVEDPLGHPLRRAGEREKSPSRQGRRCAARWARLVAGARRQLAVARQRSASLEISEKIGSNSDRSITWPAAAGLDHPERSGTGAAP